MATFAHALAQNWSDEAAPLADAPVTHAETPFRGVLDGILSAAGGPFAFDGCVARDHAAAVWAWLAPTGSGSDTLSSNPPASTTPDFYRRMRSVWATASADPIALQRLTAQLGSIGAVSALPRLSNALKYLPLLAQAPAFGRLLNERDGAGLAEALRAAPLAEPDMLSMVMRIAVAHVIDPQPLVATAVELAGGCSETDVAWGGFTALIEALLALAQDSAMLIAAEGALFADADLICRALDRFHRLVGAVVDNVSLTPGSRWSTITSTLKRLASERAGPWLRDVAPAVARALRPRDSNRGDPDRALHALNGLYVLVAVRKSAESLALRAVADEAWTQVGEALESGVELGLDALHDDPGDAAAAARLAVGMKVAELRFGEPYAQRLAAARDAGLR